MGKLSFMFSINYYILIFDYCKYAILNFFLIDDNIMNIGIFGGSFNPIHKAHVEFAKAFKYDFNLDLVYFVPAFQSPFKSRNDFAVADYHRINMVELAIMNYPFFKLLDYEINQKEVSYTINTIDYIAKLYDFNAKLFLLIGSDQWNLFHKWHNWQIILHSTTICIAGRALDYDNISSEISNFLIDNNIFCNYLNHKHIDISSSKIRNMIFDGKDVSNLIDDNVLNYIIDNKLYINNILS